MDSEQRLIFRLYDEASAKLKILQNNLRGFNTSYSTRVNLSVNDQITPRLTTIYQQMTSKFGAFLLRLKIDDSSTSVISKLKKTLNAMFGTDESKKWYEKIYGYLSKLGQLAAKTGTIITGIFGIGGAVLTAGMVIGVASMSKKMITLNSEMEQYKVSLQTSVGSLTAAKKEMEAIIKFAKQTPYTIQEVTQATVRLRAYAMDPETWLEPLGNAASAFGRDLTDAVEMAADYVQNQFRRAMSYGIRGSADDFKQGGKFAGQSAADALLTTLNQRFASGMRLQAQTFKGIISNIKDTMTVELAEISAPMFSAAKGILVSFYKSLADGSALGGIKQAIADASASISKILRAMTNLHNYAKRNIIPMFKDTASAMMTTFKSIVEVVGAVSEAMGSPILIVLANVLHALAVIVKNAQWAIKIFVGIATIFKLLSHNIAETGVKLLTTGKAASMFGAQLSIIAQRAVLAGAAILAMINISKFLEINSGLKQLGNSFDQIAGGAGKVKGYLKDLGNETGHTLDNMVKAAQASESFGDNAVNSLEYGARIANTLEMSTENAVQSVGKLAAAFIVIGDNSQAMAQKTEQAATALVYLKQQSEELNVSFDQVQTLMEQFPEVVAKSTNGMIGLVEIIAAASKSGKDLTKVFAALSMLSTPDFAMLTTLDPTIWVSRTSSELLDLGKNMDKLKDSDKDLASSMVASAEGVIAILDKYGKAGRVITDEFGRVQSSATIGVQEIISTLKDLDRQLKIAQEETVKWGAEVIRLESQLTEWGIELQRINIEIDKYTKKLEEANNMQPFGAKAYHKAVTDLGIAMNRLDLEKAKAELALLDKTYVQIEKDIIKMNAAIKKEEGALAPLKRRLGDITDEFNSISDAIQDAQEKLDKFTNPKLKGMGAFDDKIHSLDMQLNSLERQRLDIAKGLQPFEDAGLTDTSAYKNASAQLTALDAQIAKIENEKRKTELDRSIAYDDQLYKLEKIADTQKEITFSEALKGAQAARAEIDKLQPQMERVKAQKDALEDEVDLRQQSIDKQKRLVEQKQSELDAARSINEAAINELELQEKIYQATKDKLDAEHLVSMEKIIQAKADLERSKIYETSAQNAADAITSAQINLDSLQAQADNLGLKISQGSYDRDRVNTKYQDSQAKVTELQGDIKALVGFIPDFIKSVNYTKFVSEDMEQIATAFGSEDYATLFNDMNDTLENIDTSLATIVAQSGSGGLGFFGDMKNLATGSAAGTIATTIGTIAAAVLLKKGAGKLTSAIGKKVATSAAAGGGLATTLESKAVIRTLPKDYMKQLGLAVNKTQTDADKALVSLVKKLDRAEINRQAGERIISQKLANIDPDDVKGMDKLYDKLLKNDEKFKDALTKIDTERRFIEKTAKDKIEGLGSVMEKAKTNRLTPTDGKIIKNIIEETGSTSKVIRTAAKNMEKEAGLARRALATLVALPILGRGAGKLGQGMASGGSLLTRMRSVGYGGAQTIGDAQSIGNGNIITRVVRRLEGQIAGKVLGRVKNQRGAASIEALTFGLGGMLENRGAKAALSTADELRAGGTRTISTKMAMQAASQYGPDGKLNVQDDLVKRYAAEAKKTGKVAESIGGLKVTAVIDKTTGEIAIIDGHNRIAAAKKAGIKTIQADFSTGNWQELMGDVKKRVPGKVFPNVAELEKSGGALSRVLGKAVAPLGKLAAPLSALMNSKAGTGLKIAGKAGMFAGFGDVSQLAKPVENALAKVGMKAAGSIAGKGLGFLGKTLLGGGVAGIASLGVQAVNFLKGDFMNDKVWSRLFGGKTIQEFTKDNPVSRYLYSAFGKDNVEQMFKPLGNIWDAATNLSGAVGNVGGMATGLVKGIFTGDYKGMINNAKDFAANVGEAFFDLGNAAVNQVKSFGAAGSAFKNFFTGGSDYSAATEKLQQTQLQNAEAYGKKAIDMMKEINETKDLDQREALRAQYYIHVKDIQQKQDNMSAGVAIAKQYGEQIIQLQDAVSQAVDDDTREMYRAQLYAYQKALKDLQSTGKITPEIISSLNYDIFEINSSLREMKIPLVYDEETFNDIMSRYAKTKSDLENPIKVLIEAEIAKDSWNQAYMNMAGMAAKVMSLFGTSGRSSEQILNDAYNKVTGQGSSGGNTAVAALQSRLNQFGYGLTVDNQMGSKTRGAAQDLISKLQAEISTLTGGDRSKAKDLIREIESVLNSYQTGGITDWARSQAKLAVLHGQEAVIPLQNGYVPVTITGGNSAQGGSQPQVINNVSNTFTVRNDDDIETLKKYMLKIMQGQTGFTDNPFNYV